MKLNHSYLWKWKTKEIRFDVYLTQDFSHLKDVKQVHGCVISKDKKQVLVVHTKSDLWMLPGGSVEEGETLTETLVREIKEETNRDVVMSTIKPFYYQQAYKKDINAEWNLAFIGVRYYVMLADDLDFISDPDNDIAEVRWVNISTIDNYLDWGKTAQMIKEELPELIKNL